MSSAIRPLRGARPAAHTRSRYRAVGLGLPLGLLAAGLMLLAAVLAGGDAGRFLDWPSLAIVLGCTVAVSLASSGPAERTALLAALLRLARQEPAVTIPLQRELAAIALRLRTGSLMAADSLKAELATMPVLRRGLELAETGWSAEAVERALAVEIETRCGQEEAAVLLLRRMAELAPAMGLIGTLIGLVQMLGRLDDPGRIGPAMALALLTTLYGAGLAHGLFLPVAQRLALQLRDRLERMRLEALTAVAITRRENPANLMEQLACHLPPLIRPDRP